ncbi:MAG: ClpX C4-type zinc finger protein [Planctomycetaceae bacterium]|nr:ClpX C4-type zinc finger protein [Planctomycetaceae bacterium]
MNWLKQWLGRPVRRCSFCNHPREQAGMMVEGPESVFLCQECAERLGDVCHEPALNEHISGRCSLCRTDAKDVLQASNDTNGKSVAICHECLQLVRSIIEQESARQIAGT